MLNIEDLVQKTIRRQKEMFETTKGENTPGYGLEQIHNDAAHSAAREVSQNCTWEPKELFYLIGETAELWNQEGDNPPAFTPLSICTIVLERYLYESIPFYKDEEAGE